MAGKKKVAIFQWLRPYFAIFMIVSVVLLSYSLLIVVQIKKDADKNNRHLTEYYNASIERNLSGFTEFSNTILHSSEAEQIHNYSKETIQTDEGLRNACNLANEIRTYCRYNDVWDDIYFYYPSNDLVVGCNGAFPSYKYFKTEHVSMLPMQDEYQEWMNTLFSKRKAGFFTACEGNEVYSVYLYRDMSYYGDDEKNRVLVAKISRNLLDNMFHDLLQSEHYQYVALVDGDGHVYGDAGNATCSLSADGSFDFSRTDEKYVVYQAASSTWPLSFVCVQEYGRAYQTVRTISVIVVVGIVLALLVLLGVSILYASKRKANVERLLGRFKDTHVYSEKMAMDVIETEVDKLIQANQLALEAEDRQQKTIASFFLLEVLRQEICTEKDFELIESMYDINMENPLFSLVVAKPRKDSYKEPNLREKMLQLIREAENDGFVVFWTQYENLEVFLCNYESRTKVPQGMVLEFAKQLRDKQNDQYEIQISPIMNSVAEISGVWRQFYRQMMPKQAVLAQINEPIDKESGLIRAFGEAIDSENIVEATRILSELNRYFLVETNQNLTMCRKYCLLVKLFEHYESDAARKKIDTLMKTLNQKDWNEQLIELLQDLNLDINQPVDTRCMAEMAREIILDEYKNPQLSLHMLAERIGISQSYLSRLFKQRYAMGVVQFINITRIEKAKKLIVEGNDNLKVIALTVGFLSDVNLIRVFKKYENMTPGSFRTQNEEVDH